MSRSSAPDALPALDGRARGDGTDRREADRPGRTAGADDPGLLGLGGALLLQARISVSQRILVLPGLVLIGVVMRLVMSPMSIAAMNAAGRSKAGTASGVLSMSRMVGGNFWRGRGRALITTIGRGKLNQSLPHLPASTRAMLANSLGGGTVPGHHLPTAVTPRAHIRLWTHNRAPGRCRGRVLRCHLAWLLVERKSSLRKAMVPGAEPNAAGETTSDAASAPSRRETTKTAG